jgi:hypothetical protein
MNSIVEDMLDRASKQLADDIDKGILMSLGYVFDYYLEYGTGKVYGHDYLTVAPMNAEGQWSDMMAWVVDTFGPTDSMGAWAQDQRWYVNNAKFWFRDAKDRDWFVLRWS